MKQQPAKYTSATQSIHFYEKLQSKTFINKFIDITVDFNENAIKIISSNSVDNIPKPIPLGVIREGIKDWSSYHIHNLSIIGKQELLSFDYSFIKNLFDSATNATICKTLNSELILECMQYIHTGVAITTDGLKVSIINQEGSFNEIHQWLESFVKQDKTNSTVTYSVYGKKSILTLTPFSTDSNVRTIELVCDAISKVPCSLLNDNFNKVKLEVYLVPTYIGTVISLLQEKDTIVEFWGKPRFVLFGKIKNTKSVDVQKAAIKYQSDKDQVFNVIANIEKALEQEFINQMFDDITLKHSMTLEILGQFHFDLLGDNGDNNIDMYI